MGDPTFSPSLFLCYADGPNITPGCDAVEKVLNVMIICLMEQLHREPARGGAACDLVPSSVQGLRKDFIKEE